MTPRFALAAIFCAALAAPSALACGKDTDCVIGDRTYRIVLPAERDGPTGAIVYVHGYRGKASSVMRNGAITGLADRLGVAVIAAQASADEWNTDHVPSGVVDPSVDEPAYFDALAEDATRRFGLARDRFLIAGFSSGAMMVWNLACKRGDAYAGYAPMSGVFWRPLPDACPGGPVALVHYHGREDPVVPLHGRKIDDARQGDVLDTIALMTRLGGYGPATEIEDGALDCTRRDGPGTAFLEFCLFTGKHEMRVANIVRAWDEVAAAHGW